MDPEITPIQAIDHDDENDTSFEDAFDATENDSKLKKKPTETPAEEQQAPNTEVTPVAATPAPAPAPEYVQLTKEELDTLRAQAALAAQVKATSDKSFGTTFGKIGGIERAINELRSLPNVKLSKEDFANVGQQFPEFAEWLAADLNAALGKTKVVDVEERLKSAVDGDRTATQQAASDALTEDHPDWREVQVKPEFTGWLEQQPKRAQTKFKSTWDAEWLGDFFDRFKEHAKKAAAPPPPPAPAAPAAPTQQASAAKNRLAAAVTPKGTGGHSPAPTDDDEFLAGFNSP